MPPKPQLIAIALEQRARYDDEWPKEWMVYLFEREWFSFGRWIWPWAIALKAVVCILLGRSQLDWYRNDAIEVACWDGERHNGYPEADYDEWKYLKVGRGLLNWRFDMGHEST